MQPEIFELFDRICRKRRAGGDVLEIGATPTEDTLLRLPSLAGARSRTGLDLAGPHALDGFTILRGQANSMTMFADRSFDTVLCNSVLEHDPRFWLSLTEIRRVLRPGGLLVVGVPGYVEQGLLGDLPAGALAAGLPPWLEAATPVLAVHNHPGDYYRFSRQSVATVLMEGMAEIELVAALKPPRFVASGRRFGEVASAAPAQGALAAGPPPFRAGAAQLEALAHELAPLGPPIILFNKSHSGSRLLARALSEAGVFMGAKRNDSEDAVELLRLVEHVVDFYYPDFGPFFRDGDPFLPRIVRGTFGRHLRGFAPPGRWGWKLSETNFALPVIARLFPEARFVHLLRDGRDVAFSDFNAPTTPLLRKLHFGTDRVHHWQGLPLTEAQYRQTPHLFNARLWVASVGDARSHGAMLGDRYCEIRYESLVRDFAGTLRGLFDFLGLSSHEAALARLADLVRPGSVGRYRRAPPPALTATLAVLGPTLAAFGYGREGEDLGRDGSLSLIFLVDLQSPPAALEASLADLAHATCLRPEILIVGPEGIAEPSRPGTRRIKVPETNGEPGAALAGLAAARGAYVLFARPGMRFDPPGLAQLLREAVRADAVAAIGPVREGGGSGQVSLIVPNLDLLRWADAAPLGATLFKRRWAREAEILPLGTGDHPWWHWHLARQASEADLVVQGRHLVGEVAHPVATRLVPRTVFDRIAGTAPEAARRILVYGNGGASTELLLGGLPDRLKRELRFAPPQERERDLDRMRHASAVLLIRDFQLPLSNGTIDGAVKMGVPFYYVTDDHFPTLRQETDELSFYTEDNLRALLSHAVGAIVASPRLQEVLAPLAAATHLWPPILDPSLVPPANPGAGDEDPTLRIGIAGGTFRSAPLHQQIMPAVIAAAGRRPVEIVARAGLIEGQNGGIPLRQMAFEPCFRRFIFSWRRQAITALIHPPALTENAAYKNANALLVSRYLGAVPIVAATDPAYRDLPEASGAIVAGDGGTPWSDALEQVADPARRRDLLARLDAWCRKSFAADPGIAILVGIMERAAPVTEALLRERSAKLAAGRPLADLAVGTVP